MKSNKEFTDSIYKKYETAREEEKQKTASRRRLVRYGAAVAACFILAIGVYGAKDTLFGGANSMDSGVEMIEEAQVSEDESAIQKQAASSSEAADASDVSGTEGESPNGMEFGYTDDMDEEEPADDTGDNAFIYVICAVILIIIIAAASIIIVRKKKK